jgi:CRP/FNR family cyclic AMP-dependent transcriptional regulator
MTVENIRLLRNIPLFKEMSPQEIMLVVLAGESVWYGKGDMIFREGTEGDALYIIKSGEVRVAKYDGHGVERDLAILTTGEHFGELALIDNLPRSASAFAVSDSEIIRIPRSNFEDLLKHHEGIERKFYKAFTRILAERLRKQNDNFTFSQEMGDLIHEDEKQL